MNNKIPITKIVEASSLKGFSIPSEYGPRVKVCVFPLDQSKRDLDLITVQESSSFFQDIILSDEEDVWNDL